MIISSNRKASLEEFSLFLNNTNLFLNELAKNNNDYFLDKNAQKLEIEVFKALVKCSKNTIFENSIELVSSKYFPDIVINKYYGVEVKSSQKDFKTLGGSILESTRKEDIERIFLVFGKLKTPVEFKARAYEECLYDVAVTHYPRYQIDMDLKENETIFYKAGVSYDDFRKNPMEELKKYYKPRLKDGQSLWWLDSEEKASSAIVRLFHTLKKNEKDHLISQMLAYFPEIIYLNNNRKFNRAALWLSIEKSIVNTSIRDSFSAGGQCDIFGSTMPKIFFTILEHKETIKNILENTISDDLKYFWNTDVILENRFNQWKSIILENSKYNVIYDEIKEFFNRI